MSNIALPVVHVPVSVADTVVPNYRVVNQIAGLNRRVPWAPVTWPLRVVWRAARPSIRPGLGGVPTPSPIPVIATLPHSSAPAMIGFRMRVVFMLVRGDSLLGRP